MSPDSKLSKNSQIEVLGLNKSSVYYVPKGESEENQIIMEEIDKEHLEHPTKGVVGMRDWLKSKSYFVGERRVRRLMRLMNIHAVYPIKSLSHLGMPEYKRPYLLRNMEITHPNQVWSIDITYIPMAKGFMYLVAIIDVYSRFIVGWGLYNSLDRENSIDVLEQSIAQYGCPEIINSDQGCQYTSKDWIETCTLYDIKISMDGKSRCLDNIWIERFWRTIKREYVYLNPDNNVSHLSEGIKNYIHYYNTERPHQSLDNHAIPIKIYKTGKNDAA
jgi:putative transposase